jgi:hypothetical protein
MAYKKVGLTNFFWPGAAPAGTTAAVTLDAAGEKFAIIGHVKWADGGSHTINTSGSSKIYLHTGSSPVFDDATAVMRVGFQGVDNTTGAPVRPNGSWSIYADAIPSTYDASPTFTTASSLCGITPNGGTGTSFAEGDLVAIVADLTTVGTTPASSMTFVNALGNTYAGGGVAGLATAVQYTTGAWTNITSGAPIVLFRANDGTWGTLYGTNVIGQCATVSPTDSAGTDEYGTIFQVPFKVKVDAVVVVGGTGFGNTTTSDFQIDLTSTPTGTPSTLISGPIAYPAETFGNGGTLRGNILRIPLTELLPDTDYCVSLKATSTGSINIFSQTLPDAGARALFDGNTTSQGATRNNGSGAYTGSTTVMYSVGLRIAEIDVAASGGSGVVGVIGS